MSAPESPEVMTDVFSAIRSRGGPAAGCSGNKWTLKILRRPDEHLHELRSSHRQEQHTRFTSLRFRGERLACPWRSRENRATRILAPTFPYFAGLLQLLKIPTIFSLASSIPATSSNLTFTSISLLSILV